MGNNYHGKNKGGPDGQRDQRRPDRNFKPAGGGSAPGGQDKSMLQDVSEQGLDTFLGPLVRNLVAKLPESWFRAEESRKLIGWVPLVSHGLSLLIARLTHSSFGDAIRTRATAALSDSINARLRGETLSTTAGGPATKLGEAVDRYMASFFSFIMQLPETEWAAWKNGLDELDADKRARVGLLFAGMNDRQLDKIVRTIHSSKSPIHDWGMLLQTADTMGMFGGGVGSKAPTVLKPGMFAKFWLGVSTKLSTKQRATITGFLEWVRDQVSVAAHVQCQAAFMEWTADDFKLLAALKSHEGRYLLLFSDSPRPSASDQYGWLAALVGLPEKYRKRQKRCRKELNRTGKRLDREIAALRKELDLEV